MYTAIKTFCIQANLVNEGTFESNFGITIDGASHSNSGTLRINQGAAGSYKSWQSRFTFTSGATFTNTGMVILDTTAMLFIESGATFTNTGTVILDTAAIIYIKGGATYHGETGTLDGTGTLSLSGGTHAYLGSKFVVKEYGPKLSTARSTIHVDSLINQGTWTARGDTVYADSVIINQGKLILEPYYSSGYYYSTWYGPLINQDTLIVEPWDYSSGYTANEFLSGPVVNEAGAIISVSSNASKTATLTVDSSLTNHGKLELKNAYGAPPAANLNVNKGWLTNTGTIDGLATSTVKANLDNQGIFNVNPNIYLTMDKNPQYILNSGEINVTGGDYFKVNYLDSLVNSGTIQIDAGRTVQLYGPYVSGNFPTHEATFALEGAGVLSNAGVLDIKYLSVNLGAKWVISNSENVTLYSSRVAADSLINEGYLTMSNASITGEVVNRDTLVATGYGAAFDSTLVNEDGAYIRADGSYSSWTYLNVDNAFTNHGTLELTTTYSSSRGVKVDVQAGSLGSLMNSSTGSINAIVGTTTSITLQHKLCANLDNQGSITLSAPTLLSKASHTNSGTMQVDTTLTIVGTSFSNEVGGIVQGKGTLNTSSVAFTNAGTIAPGGSPGILSVTGDLILAPTSVIEIEITGAEPGTEYDQLNVTGNVALGGDLQVDFINPYSPTSGTFMPLAYTTSSGALGSLTTGVTTFLSAQITGTGVYLYAGSGNSWPFIGRIADITALEDTILAIPLQAFDPDEGDVLTLNAESDITAVVVAIVEDTLKISPELNWNGKANIKVIVADPAGLKG